MIFIYGLTDPDTNEVRYVGKTDNLATRMYGHRMDQRNGNRGTCSRERAEWYLSLKERGLEPLPVVLDQVDDAQGSDREGFWMERLRRQGHRLTNQQNGYLRRHNTPTKVVHMIVDLLPDEYGLVIDIAYANKSVPLRVLESIVREYLNRIKGNSCQELSTLSDWTI